MFERCEGKNIVETVGEIFLFEWRDFERLKQQAKHDFECMVTPIEFDLERTIISIDSSLQRYEGERH